MSPIVGANVHLGDELAGKSIDEFVETLDRFNALLLYADMLISVLKAAEARAGGNESRREAGISAGSRHIKDPLDGEIVSAEFRLNHWLVQPYQSRIVRADNLEHQVRVDPKAMQVLVYLAEKPGEVVPKEKIIDSVWEGVFVTDEVLTNAIWELRKALGDDARSPRYIQTVPRKGYRLIVEPPCERILPRWTHFLPAVSRPAVVAGAILAALVLTVVWGLWSSRPRPAQLTSPAVVAVLPFSVRGSQEFAYLSEGMVDLLGTTLNTESQRVVDPKTLLRHVEREGGGELGPEEARRIARRFGAGRYVLGTVVESAGHLRIQSSLYDSSADAIVTRASVEGERDDLFTMIDNLTSRLLVGMHPGPGSGGHRPSVASMTTESLEALKAFLEGDKAMRPGSMDLEKAYRSFQRAVELDPTFALAWYRLAYAAGFDLDPDPSREYFREALRRAERLSERDRLRVQASFNFLHGSPKEAERLFKELLDKYPDDADAWAQLSQLYGFFNWRDGRFYEDTIRLSMECAERAQALDAANFDAAMTLHGLYAWLGRHEDFKRQREILGETRGRAMFAARAYLSLLQGDRQAWEQVLQDMKDDDVLWFPHQLVIAHLPDQTDRVREFIEAFYLPESCSAEQRAGGHITLAIFAAARGRWSEAKMELAAAEPLYPEAALEFEAILSLSPFLEIPREDLVSIRDKLARWEPVSARQREEIHYPEKAGFPYPPGLRAVLRPYLLGILSAHLGDKATALRCAAELEQIPAPELMPSMPSDLAGSVRAHVALNEGREGDALALLESARMDPYMNRYYRYAPFVFTTLAHERFLRAELLYELGREEEALGWYGTLFLIPSFAFAHLRIAEIREKQGDPAEAIEHYDLFKRFWNDCDPELRPVVEDARRRLQRLRGRMGLS